MPKQMEKLKPTNEATATTTTTATITTATTATSDVRENIESLM